MHHLREVQNELCRAGLTADPHKYHLRLTEAQYLVYHNGRGLLKLQKKIEAIKNYPQPKYKTGMCLFGIGCILQVIRA